MDYLFNFLIQYHQNIALYWIGAFLFGWVIVKIDRFYTKTTALHTAVPDMQAMLSRIDKGLTLLNKVLLEKTVITESCYSNENSPRAINTLGEELLTDSNAIPLFESIKDKLVVELESKEIKSLLELERESLNVLLAHSDDPEYKPLQDFVYQHPTYKDTPLAYSDLLFVVALKLRDFYRTKHPELK